MLKTHNQKHYESLLESVKSSKCSAQIKTLLIQSLIELIKKRNEEFFQETLQQFTLEPSVNAPSYQFENEELEEKILEKRAVKFQLNDQMQGVQDYLYEIQKVVETKRRYDEKLKRQIRIKIQAINQQKQIISQNNKSYFEKSFSVVSDIFKGWLN